MPKRTELTESQSHIVRMAYSDDYVLYGGSDDFDGVSPASLRSVLKRGWVAPVDPDDPDDELELTEAGRSALGIPAALKAPPKRFKTAVLRALDHFMGPESATRQPGAVFRPECLPGTVWVNDEQKADFSEALLLVDMDEADLNGFDQVDWSCAARLVSEMGFPCYVTNQRYIQAFWPEEE